MVANIRLSPLDTVDGAIEYLKKTGYEGRMSLECRHIPDFETSVKNAYELLGQFR